MKLGFADTEVDSVVLMGWHIEAGPFYGMGGSSIEQLDTFPVEIDAA
ncbi:hypothetical protein N9087_00645 [bacterium]|nr:hypothetical protein [Rubripirellula sp.]MDA7864939.1 hypothetical protein [bacterium]MDB4506176.1 hypothetical protein [bacterium]MDB4644802.1 hypothetical protein [Rubripirellula sp.]